MKPLRSSRILAWAFVLTLLAAGVFLIQSVGDRAYAQPLASDLVKADVGKVLIDPADTVILRPSRTSVWRNYGQIP
jgi:hypothetical protein